MKAVARAWHEAPRSRQRRGFQYVENMRDPAEIADRVDLAMSLRVHSVILLARNFA
jgi:hypothetical protein